MNYLQPTAIPLNSPAVVVVHGHSVVMPFDVRLSGQLYTSTSVIFIYDINQLNTKFCMVRSDEINLSIDRLAHYEIKKPIPVRIECIDHNEFLAEVSDANIAMTGDSIGDALTMLKENIEAIFERYESKERLGTEASHQLRFLEAHIGTESRK